MAMATTHPLLFQGTLLDRQGNAVEGAKIQLWQTDLDGNYLHPQADSFPASPEHASIVSQFQYFGTDTTDSYGSFDFLTYRPGIYTQRPYSHFHFMVWLDDLAMGDAETPALITQFYFKDESPPSWFPAVLQLDVTEADPAAYEYGSYVNGTIVVDVNPTGGNALLAASPAQPKGPFYPKTDFFSVGNDLTTSDDASSSAASLCRPACGNAWSWWIVCYVAVRNFIL
mmetsp:Transcript_38963/g.83151  ORF Transcript_38963/g.83151 Transcript_38963/m.83151 type:complete len:227 (+) Transcript_38963:130-810(+)